MLERADADTWTKHKRRRLCTMCGWSWDIREGSGNTVCGTKRRGNTKTREQVTSRAKSRKKYMYLLPIPLLYILILLLYYHSFSPILPFPLSPSLCGCNSMSCCHCYISNIVWNNTQVDNLHIVQCIWKHTRKCYNKPIFKEMVLPWETMLVT